ncbi:MAG: hypothetical protein CMM99_01005 [Rickettsiales bacterium]|nr:hypothetical protein [Rickettsiales bacterium]
MNLFVNDIIESISESFTSGEKFQITNIKTISGNLHATIINLRDKNSEFTVALSVLEDKNRFKVVKKF